VRAVAQARCALPRCVQAETDELVGAWMRALRESQESYVGLESFELLQVRAITQ
jgi:hypothetical protein